MSPVLFPCPEYLHSVHHALYEWMWLALSNADGKKDDANKSIKL